jgi:hypothetical protein
MAVSLVTTIARYLGLAADDKPTDCPPGSTFYAFDSQTTYVFDGTDWYAQ